MFSMITNPGQHLRISQSMQRHKGSVSNNNNNNSLHFIQIMLLSCLLFFFIAPTLQPFVSAEQKFTFDDDDLDAVHLIDPSKMSNTTAMNNNTLPIPTTPKMFNITTRRLGALVEQKPSSITVEAPRGPDVEDKIVLYQREDGSTTLAMTPKQACDICHTTIDTGMILLRRGVQINSLTDEEKAEVMAQMGKSFLSSAQFNATTQKLQWDSQNMAEELCEMAMAQYKPHYTIGCHELIAEHHETIWAPFNHLDLLEVMFNDTSVLEHKLKFCYRAGKCVVAQGLTEEQFPCVENTPVNRTKCESCVELANDIRMIFKRLITTLPNPNQDPKLTEKCTLNRQQFQGFVSTWCGSLPLRHFRPEGLAEVCDLITGRLLIDDKYNNNNNNQNNNELDNHNNNNEQKTEEEKQQQRKAKEDELKLHQDKMYELMKDGNILHRLFKDKELWEETLCTKVNNLCSTDDIKQLYHQWDEAADYDFNVTQYRYLLHEALEGHSKLLRDLEEEYFYSPKHMYGPDLTTMSEEEQAEYRAKIKRDAKIASKSSTKTTDDDIDLDLGFDENDEAKLKKLKKLNTTRIKKNKTEQDKDQLEEEEEFSSELDSTMQYLEEESTTGLSPDMSGVLLGKLSYIDEQGVRVPNQLPPHILREYKAKRHETIHNIKHQQMIEHYQKKLDTLRESASKYILKRRVYALPDTMHVSARMSAILTNYLNRHYERQRGQIAEQLIQETYQKQLNEMKMFSDNYKPAEYQQTYDFDDEEDTTIQQHNNDQGNDEVANEVDIPTTPPTKKTIKHDEL